ncbi:MAG: hypothetical protein L6V81_09690 [Clostridium sp.]|nr:MAG: hypothetical protein L6V81_09690 [Clostridium sp.]
MYQGILTILLEIEEQFIIIMCFYVKDNYLMVKSSYIYLSIRLNNNEYDKYLNDIINTLEK